MRLLESLNTTVDSFTRTTVVQSLELQHCLPAKLYLKKPPLTVHLMVMSTERLPQTMSGTSTGPNLPKKRLATATPLLLLGDHAPLNRHLLRDQCSTHRLVRLPHPRSFETQRSRHPHRRALEDSGQLEGVGSADDALTISTAGRTLYAWFMVLPMFIRFLSVWAVTKTGPPNAPKARSTRSPSEPVMGLKTQFK